MHDITMISPSDVPSDPGMRREWIKFQLRIRGTTLAGVGRDLGINRAAVGKAMNTHYARVEQAIAERLGLRPEQLWPERYEAEPDRALERRSA